MKSTGSKNQNQMKNKIKFPKSVVWLQGEFAEAAVDVVQAVAKIHSYVIQSDIPPDVTDVDMYQINREIILNGAISQTKTFAATSKSAASLWPPPKANETAIDTVRKTDQAESAPDFNLFFFSVNRPEISRATSKSWPC